MPWKTRWTVPNTAPTDAYSEAVQVVEDHIAAILDARESCTDIELLLRRLRRRGLMDDAAYQEAITHLNVIRRGLELGQKYARRVRRSPLA